MGHILTLEGLRPDPNKVAAVVKMQSPIDTAGVQRFLGMANYLARFLPGIPDMCEPLRQLTRKEIQWEWADHHKQLFRTIRRAITSALVLKYFDAAQATGL